MNVGVLINMRNVTDHLYRDICKLHNQGFHSCQINTLFENEKRCDFADDYFTDERAAQINAACTELDFKVTALFAGWSGYKQFAYPENYCSIGFVPSYLRERRISDVLNGADFAHKIHVQDVVTHIGFVGDNPNDPERKAIVLSLRYIADCLKERGQYLHIETGEMIPVSLVQLICEIDRENVGINFDPANFLINGRANPSDAIDLLLPYVRSMHVKDGVYPTGTNPKGHETPVGEGSVDFEYIISKMLDNGYKGSFTIEREISGEQQAKDIIRAANYIRNIINSKNISNP